MTKHTPRPHADVPKTESPAPAVPPEETPGHEDHLEVVEKYLNSANTSTGHLRFLYYIFVILGLYLIGVFANIDHEHLLTEKPIILPIVQLSLPFKFAFTVLPALYVLFHFVILLQFYLLSKKLHTLNEKNGKRKEGVADTFSDRISDFMLGHLIVGNHSILRFFLKLIFILSLVALPLFLVIFIQYHILPYQNIFYITEYQYLIVWTFIQLLLFEILVFLYHPIKDRAWQKANWSTKSTWSNIIYTALYLATLLTMLFHAGYTSFMQLNFPQADSEIKSRYEKISQEQENTFPILLGLFSVPINDHLVIKDRVVSMTKDPDPQTERDIREGKHDSMRRFQPLNIENRTFNLADFSGSIFPYMRAKNVDFKYATMNQTKFYYAEFEGVTFDNANLEESSFFGARFKGTKPSSLNFANLKKADLSLVKTDFTQPQEIKCVIDKNADEVDSKTMLSMIKSDLEGSKLILSKIHHANMLAANFNGAKVQGADLRHTCLIGTHFQKADLSSANLESTNLWGIDLVETKLIGVNLKSSDIKGLDF